MSLSSDPQLLDETELDQVSGGRATLHANIQVAATETNFFGAFDVRNMEILWRSTEGVMGPHGRHT